MALQNDFHSLRSVLLDEIMSATIGDHQQEEEVIASSRFIKTMNSKYQLLSLTKEGLNLKTFIIENSNLIQDSYREESSQGLEEVYSLTDLE